ncbi:MAG: hypothetical protein M4579_004993 [Chaenotheca gracillima]|nr:MAG: hypothetical protein M4579_004993 [Chaenotheca gracillima]
MFWPSAWRVKDENTRNCWGYTFQWTPEHCTAEALHPLKYTYDKLAEDCLERIDTISPPEDASLPRNQSREHKSSEADKGETRDPAPKRDLYALLRDHAEGDELLSKLWSDINRIPEWVDWDQIQRGQDVFYRYGGPALTGLAYQSLLGGMGGNRVVETLARTGGFSTKVAKQRMYETTQHILQCTNSLESIKPGGPGHVSSVRVRFLHAAVRRRIMKLATQRAGYFDTEKLGIPINDLDCIATICTFSATLIWLSFPRQGLLLRRQETEDYIALWRLIAHYMGTPTDVFETPEKTKAMWESLLISEIDPSETSTILANNVINSLAGQPPSYVSRDFLCAGAHWLNGHELADRLGIERPTAWYVALMAGQCVFFMALCYFYRSVPALDRRKIKNQALRRIFYAVIVEHKHGLGEATNFEFKYVPDYDVMTDMNVSKAGIVQRSGVERRNFISFLIASIAVSSVCWVSMKAVSSLTRTIVSSVSF